MTDGTNNFTDMWLMRNLHGQGTVSLFGTTMSSYRLRVLQIMLALAALAVAVMWYVESTSNLTSAVDAIGYPALLTVTSLGTVTLYLRPGSLQKVVTTVYITFISYLLSSYYYIVLYQGFASEASSYMLATLALWLPLSYVVGYVFFSPQAAVRSSLGIYAAICLPQLILVGTETSLGSQITFAILVSHPVYIAALWGVARLKLDASGIHALAKSMSVAATVDQLTGVANRRAILHALESVTRVLASSERPVALMLFDVDHFKSINDRYGHAMGDKVLVTLAQHATSHLRASDLLGRWGGEEFMILALDQTGPQALQMAERLRSDLEQIIYPDVGSVTVSIGVTTLLATDDAERFVSRADVALYRAKGNGRNRVEGLFSGTDSLT